VPSGRVPRFRTRPYPSTVLSVRDRFDLARPVICASASSEPGAFSAMIRKSSRLPAEKTLAKDSVEVNQSDAMLAARDPHGARLHLLVARDAYVQRRNGVTPLARNPRSTAVQKSASRFAASW
jgi:hypothetical protein